jgi:hypothetical protein
VKQRLVRMIHRRWRMWSDDKSTAANSKSKSIAAPLIGDYDSGDAEVVRWHIRRAKAAAIDVRADAILLNQLQRLARTEPSAPPPGQERRLDKIETTFLSDVAWTSQTGKLGL